MGLTELTEMIKKTPEVIDKLLEAFAGGATYLKAAEMVGMNRVTLYKWRVEDPELDRQIDEAKVSRVKMVEDALFVGAMKGNVIAQIFFLKNKGGYKDSPLVDSKVVNINYGWSSEESSDQVPASEISKGDSRLE